MKRLLFAILLISSTLAFAQDGDKERDIEKFFLRYVDELKTGHYDDALNRWALLDRTISDQLRLHYLNEPMKLEMESPLWLNLDALRSGDASITIDTVRFSRDFASLNYTIVNGDNLIPGRAYMMAESVLQPSLVSPLHVYCEAWEEVHSQYLKVKFRDPSLFAGTNLERLDRFVETTAKKLGVTNERLIILETLKFNAFICESYGEVEQITGKLAMGSLLPSMDAVISKYMPPYNEVAQFLVAYALDGAPAHTHPILKEGTATYLGGRWGRSKPVLASLGSYLYLNDLTTLDTLMTSATFYSFEANPDFAYPLAGLLCEYLWNQLGRNAYLDLYRSLSGTAGFVDSLTVDQTKAKIAAATGKDWTTLESDFKAWVKQQQTAGIYTGAAETGDLVFESGTQNILMKVFEDSLYYNFNVTMKQSPLEGALLLGSLGSDKYSSFLFKEQFADTTYSNQRFGVRFSAQEVGTYDYYSNEITGKYIVGISGTDPLADAKNANLRFHVDKKLLEGFSLYINRVVEIN